MKYNYTFIIKTTHFENNIFKSFLDTLALPPPMESFITSAIPLLLVKNKYQLSNVKNSNKTPKKVKTFCAKLTD